MNYLEKVKKSDKIYSLVSTLEYGDKLTVEYGTDRDGNVRRFNIQNYNSINKNRPTYSISEGIGGYGDSMNIDQVTKTQLKAYTFDMMKNKTTYNFPIHQMKFIKVERKLKGEEYYIPQE